jgi:hypothetical protein
MAGARVSSFAQSMRLRIQNRIQRLLHRVKMLGPLSLFISPVILSIAMLPRI